MTIVTVENRTREALNMSRKKDFVYEKLEIKILILFILRRLPEPISLKVLTELALNGGGISYFDFMECVADLTKTEHISLKDGKYSLTAKGVRNGKITENSLPYFLRMDAESITAVYRSEMNRNAMIKTSHMINPDGNCSVSLSLSDGIGDIVSMNLFAMNEKHALALESGFRKRAESIYNEIIKNLIE